jgi:hypothetical protein
MNSDVMMAIVNAGADDDFVKLAKVYGIRRIQGCQRHRWQAVSISDCRVWQIFKVCPSLDE